MNDINELCELRAALLLVLKNKPEGIQTEFESMAINILEEIDSILFQVIKDLESL